MARTRISQSFRSHNDPPLIVAGVETLKHWAQWNINSLMVKYVHIWNSILSQKNCWWPDIGSWIASFRIPIISITREDLFVKNIDFIVYWATFWQSTQDNYSNDIKCIIRLWAESGYSCFITQKSHMISWSIFRTKLVKLGLMSCPDHLYNDISLNSVLLTFEYDYHPR